MQEVRLTILKAGENRAVNATWIFKVALWYSNIFNFHGYSSSNSPNHDSVNNVEQIIIAPSSLSTGAPLNLGVSAVSLPGGNQDFAVMVDNAHE